MSPAFSATSSWSSMQSRVTTPRSTSHGQSAWNEDEDVQLSANLSRYRVLDGDQKKRETDDVERIINDIKAQRRCRSTSSRTKRSSSRQEAPVAPIRSGSPRLKDKPERSRFSRRDSGRHSFKDFGEGDELLPAKEKNPAAETVPQSFQDQVLQELRKLKEAQRIEFEALERLQREKDEAEKKARRLEERLRQQQRRLSHREDNSSHGSTASRRTKTRQEVILVDDASDEENNNNIYSSSDKFTGDSCVQDNSGTEGEDPEFIHWEDATKSPPPYYTTASPATSPFKRSSGWPAWTGDESLPPGPASEPQECNSPEPTKLLRDRSRSRTKLERTSSSRSRSNSAMSSHVRRLSRSRSGSPSATRTSHSARDSQELRRSGAFFENKARAQAEAEQLAREAAERLERACHAAPPQKLLERQALADQRRSQQLKELEKTKAELAREKRAKAREVPVTTYLSATDAEEAEQKRKERIRQRAQELMQAAELPPRMAVASKNATVDAGEGGSEGGHMSVKLKKKLRQAAAEEAERRKRRPKPVPNFDQLHSPSFLRAMASPTYAPQWNAKQLKQMAAGGGAGIVAKTVVAPFERVKIVCQTGESVGMLQTTRSIFVSEGVVGFWRGNLAACVRVVPHKAVLFAFSDFYKDLFRSMDATGRNQLPAWGPFVSGSLSGFTASVITYPLDLIRTRVSGQIGDKLVYSGIVHTFMRTLREEGPRALFRGIGPTLFGALPYEGIKFGSYDLLTAMLPEDIDPKADFVGKILCGGGAGVLATIFTYPNDTVRRRLQMQGAGGVTRQYRNAWDCYVQLARNEGWTVYYRGLTPTLVRAMPNMGVQFATYDFLKSLID